MRARFPTKSIVAVSIIAGLGAVVSGTFAARAAMVFSENFSGAAPNTGGAAYGVGSIAGTQLEVAGGNIDIAGILNGKVFSCAGNAGGKRTTG